MRSRILFCVFLVFSARSNPPVLDANSPLTMTVTPAHTFAPANVHVQIRFEPSDDNRALEIVADSSTFYRSSTVPLDGERAPCVFGLDFLNLPTGDYEIRSILMNAAGQQRALVRRQVTVLLGSDR